MFFTRTQDQVEICEDLATLQPQLVSMTSQPQTAIQCLARVAGHHGIDLSVGRLCHTYAVGEAPISPLLLLRMAKEAGLRARFARLTWDELVRLGQAYPALAQLANGNWVVVAAVRKCGWRGSGGGSRPARRAT